MNPAVIAFLAVGLLTAVATIGVVAARSVLHSALALATALLGAAGLFIIFGGEFAGLVQILVYIGAVVVLFMFGIMLTSSRTSKPVNDNDQRGAALVVSIGIFVVLTIATLAAFSGSQIELQSTFPAAAIGEDIFTTWILPFEAVSVLLLAALIGAIVLARKD